MREMEDRELRENRVTCPLPVTGLITLYLFAFLNLTLQCTNSGVGPLPGLLTDNLYV